MDITVIVPTLASKSRAAQIKRCVQSIRDSSIDPIKIVVIVNGNRHDAAVVDWLRVQPDIQFEAIPTPSLPNAVLRGRELVATEYFATLDDDDEYLPGSSDLKLAALKAQPDADLVVTNSYRCVDGSDNILFADFKSILPDPLASLFRIAWLNSGNALYRSSSVQSPYFANFYPYFEWTWLAYQLAMSHKKIHAIDAPCHRYNVTPGSLSASNAQRDAYLGLYERMLSLNPPPQVSRIIRKRMAEAWHDRSADALARGARREALVSHLRSLSLPGGLRYLTYTRRLVPGWPNG